MTEFKMQILKKLENLQLASSSQTLLVNLSWLRNFEIISLILISIVCLYILKLELPLTPLALTVGLLVLGNIGLYLRLKKDWPVSQLELFGNILLDCLILSLFILYTGGASNPFISIYLVLIAVSVVVLSFAYAFVVALFCAAIYTITIFYLPETHIGHHDDFQLHLFGMWINFILSTVCIIIFVFVLKQALSAREKSLAAGQAQSLQDEHIVALGSLAAGTAHELGTPLSTINLIGDKLIHENKLNTDKTLAESLNSDLYLLKQQVEICRDTLDKLRSTAENPDEMQSHRISIKEHIDSILDKWLLLRPETEENIKYLDDFQNTQVQLDQRFYQSIICLLNNASDASATNNSTKVTIEISCDGNYLDIKIFDEGQGLKEDLVQSGSHIIPSSKRKGFGLGLMLSNSNINKLGGELNLINYQNQGTTSRDGERPFGLCAHVRLPLE